MSTEHKGVMPSHSAYGPIATEVYLNHVATNPQVHFDLAKEFADPLLPDYGTYEPIDLTIFIKDVRGNLQEMIDNLR